LGVNFYRPIMRADLIQSNILWRCDASKAQHPSLR
jgi:hypothetical protein